MVDQDDGQQFRPSLRYLWLCFGPIMLGFWVSACVRKDDLAMLPLLTLLAAALTAGAAWLSLRRLVTVTGDALIVRSGFGERTLPWSTVQTVNILGGTLSVTTADGVFMLPVAAAATADTPAAGRPRLADAVWSRWAAQPGSSVLQAPVIPWQPPLDVHGRRVLRAPLTFRAVPAAGFIGASIGLTVAPVGSMTDALLLSSVQVAVLLCATVLYNLWARVTIDDEAVVVQTLTNGRRRVLRREILGIEEVSTGWGNWAARRLVLVTPSGPVPLRIPATRQHWYAADPLFYRKWAWLQQTLVVRARPDERAPRDTPA